MLIGKPITKIQLYLLVFFLTPSMPPSKDLWAESIQKDTELIHWVSRGESLHKIARRYLPLTEELTVGDLVEKLTAAGGNTVILDGKDMSGMLSYPSKVSLAGEIGANGSPVTRDLAKLIHYLHERNIHVGMRLVLFYDQLLATEKPELALRDSITAEPLVENGKVAWVDPSHPTVQEYNLAIARELAEMGVDEIQFDYIRFPTKKNIEYAQFGPDGQSTPRDKIITDFLAHAQNELAPYKVLLSIDVFGIIAWGRSEDIEMTGQKVEDLARHCDVVSPMIYPSHFHRPFQGIANPNDQPYLLVSETCQRFARFLANSQATLRPWIQAFPLGALTLTRTMFSSNSELWMGPELVVGCFGVRGTNTMLSGRL